MSDQILVTRSSMPPFEEYLREIEPLWESHWLTNMGVEHQKLEDALKSYLNVDNIELFVNGHSALECVLEAMQLGADGRSFVNHRLRDIKGKENTGYFLGRGTDEQTGVIILNLCIERSEAVNQVKYLLYGHGVSFLSQ